MKAIDSTAFKVNDSLLIAKTLFEHKDYKQALKVALSVNKYAEHNHRYNDLYRSSYLIAEIFQLSNNYDKSLEYFRKTFKLYKKLKLKETSRELKLYYNISALMYYTGHIDSAIYFAEKVLTIDGKTLKLPNITLSAYTNISGYYIETNQIDKAEEYIKTVLLINDSIINKTPHRKDLLNNLGAIHLIKKRYKLAFDKFAEAVALIDNDTTIDAFNMREMLFDNMAWSLYNLKNYRAYEYQEQSFNIRDSLRDAQIGGILAEIEGKFNADAIKKEEQIKTAEETAKRKHTQDINIILIIIICVVLLGSWLLYLFLKLKQVNLKLSQQYEFEQLEKLTQERILNAEIDGKEEERKMIAETLHHSVSALLSSASLHLQASKFQLKDNVPEEVNKAQKIINEASQKIRNLSHSLVSSILLRFGLEHAVQELCEKYTNSALHFSYEFSGVKRYESAFELKINSIIDELFNNIIKHSDASKAHVYIEESNAILNLLITDNGKGFKVKKDSSEKSTGLGLAQIESRINKMNGKMNIISTPSKGTVTDIVVPVIRKTKEA